MHQRVLRTVGALSVLAAAMLTLADYLLEYNPDQGVSAQIIEPIWLESAPIRYTASLNLCMLFIPFYLGGFWLLYRLLRRTHPGCAALVAGGFAYGVVMGSPFLHGVMCLNPLIYGHLMTAGVSKGVVHTLIEGTILHAVFPTFLLHYLLTWVLVPTLLFVLVARGRTVLPRWFCLCNPLVFLLAGLAGSQIWPDVFRHLLPGSLNKGNLAMFAVCLLWTVREGKEIGRDPS